MSPVPPPPPPAPMPPPPAPAAPAPKKSNKALIVILVILGIIFLIVASCAVTCAYGVKKAKDFSNKYEKNPELAGIVMAITVHPDLQVVSEDADKGVVTVRNKKTGQVAKINVAEIRSGDPSRVLEALIAGNAPGKESVSENRAADSEDAADAEDDSGPEASAEPEVSAAKAASMAASMQKLSKFIPLYPGAKTTESSTTQFGDSLGAQYVALTSDSVSDIVEFYTNKFQAAGLSLAAHNEDSNDYGPVATLAFFSNKGTATVTIETQESGKVRLEVGFAGVSR